MKKIICLVLCILILPNMAMAMNIEDMTQEELVDLYAQAGRELWYATDWDSAIIPFGVWEIGVDIPAGKYTITTATETSMTFSYGKKLLSGGLAVDAKSEIAYDNLRSRSNKAFIEGVNISECDIELKNGCYLRIQYGFARLIPKEKTSKYKFSSSSTIDVDGMSKKELYELREKIAKEIPQKETYRKIIVPEGIYTLGKEDAIHWQVESSEGESVRIEFNILPGSSWGEVFASLKSKTKEGFDEYTQEWQVDFVGDEGMKLQVKDGTAIFSSFIGKKDITFE